MKEYIELLQQLVNIIELLQRLFDRLEGIEQKTSQLEYNIGEINKYQKASVQNLQGNMEENMKQIQLLMQSSNKESKDLINALNKETKDLISELDIKVQTINKKISAEDQIKENLLYKDMHHSQYVLAVAAWYKSIRKQTLDMSNPQTFNEKIQWLKVHENNPLKTILTDKYLVKDWIKEKLGAEYIIPLLGVWEKFDDIDFDALPDRFVLKCNHGAGFNAVIKDKSSINILELKVKFDYWMKINFAFIMGFELQYKDIPRKIIAEEYVENSDGELHDYKIWCFNGKAEFIHYTDERQTRVKQAFFDRDWNRMPFVYNCPRIEKTINRPGNLGKLLEMAEVLSNGFKFARVDFYLLDDGSIKFGEITFSPEAGIGQWHPQEYNMILGQKIDLMMS